MAKFQRTKHYAYPRLGSKQKSKQRYQRATGRHNKTRQKWASRTPMVEVGYKNKTSERFLINGKMPVQVYSLKDLNKVGKNNIIIIGKIGNRNKLEIAKEILNKKLEAANLNAAKFVKNMERILKKSKAKESKEAKK